MINQPERATTIYEMLSTLMVPIVHAVRLFEDLGIRRHYGFECVYDNKYKITISVEVLK